MRVVPLALRRDPLEVLASLAAEPGAFLLEVPDPAQPLTLLGCAPRARLRILADGCIERDGRLAGGDPLAALERFVAEGPSLPFPYGSAVGYLAYELGRCTEPGRDGGPPAPDGPLAVLSRYDPVLAYDRSRAQYPLVCAEPARRHPVPHGAYLDVGQACLLANSPELFLRRRGERVETRPIKGTRPRGNGRARDAALAAELEADTKERAEHVMIVDLERNDLGRVAAIGSVAVEAYARVESHPTVHHLVSSVVGRVRPHVGLARLLRATFPGGSITGAPKVRAMEIIRELEPVPRGVYTGAFG